MRPRVEEALRELERPRTGERAVKALESIADSLQVLAREQDRRAQIRSARALERLTGSEGKS